jgi:hypothetical protein
MEMETIKKITIGVLIVAIVALVAWFLISLKPKPKPVVTPSFQATTTVSNVVATQISQLDPTDNKAILEEKSYPLGIRQLAMSFAERYGSYSSQADFKNFSDLEPVMTQKLHDSITNIISKGVSPDTYSGYDTKALSINFVKMDNASGVAEVEVQTQRQYHQNIDTVKVIYQTLDLKFVMDGGEWKVDYAKWE